MAVWLMRPPLDSGGEEALTDRDFVTLPFDGLPDLSGLRGLGDCKRIIAGQYPDAAPETLNRLAEQVWRYYHGLHREDIIAVPLPAAKEVAIAEVIQPYIFVGGEHRALIKWHAARLKGLALRHYSSLFDATGEAMAEVDDAALRTLLRSKLPHSYNRFAGWKWLLAALFAMGLLQRLIQFIHGTR